MKELLIELVLEGLQVTFTDGGFALKDSVEIRLIKRWPADSNGVKVRTEITILNHRQYPDMENAIRDLREKMREAILKEQG